MILYYTSFLCDVSFLFFFGWWVSACCHSMRAVWWGGVGVEAFIDMTSQLNVFLRSSNCTHSSSWEAL